MPGPEQARAALAKRVGASLAEALPEQDVRDAAAGLSLGGGELPSWPDAEDGAALAPPGPPRWDLMDVAGLRTLLRSAPVMLVARDAGPVRAHRKTVVRFAEGVHRGPCTIHVTRADQPEGWDAAVPVRIVFGRNARAVAEALTGRLVPGAQQLVGDASVVRAEQRLRRSGRTAAAESAESGMLALVLELSSSVDLTLVGSIWRELISRPPGKGVPDVRWKRRRVGLTPVYRAAGRGR